MNEDIVATARARFSGTYAEARQKFRDHAKEVRTYPSTARGPEGQELSTDVAWCGAVNGTHDEYWQRLLGDRHLYVCLEFGTYEPERPPRAPRRSLAPCLREAGLTL